MNEELRPVVAARRNERLVALEIDAELGAIELERLKFRGDRLLEFQRALPAGGRERVRRSAIGAGRVFHGALEAADLAAAKRERGKVVGVFLREGGQAVDRNVVLAAHRPEREQALLAALELMGIGGARRERALDLRRSALDGVDRFVQRPDARLDELRRVGHAALQAAREREQEREDSPFAGQVIARVADIGRDLLALHHRLPARRKRLLLVRLNGELGEFVMRMGGELGFHLGGIDPGALRGKRPLGLAQGGVSAPRRGRERLEPAIGVDESAMGRGIGQRALVVLTVDFDQRRGERAQSLCAHAAVVDIGAGAPVGELDAPEDQFVADFDVQPFEQRVGGVALRQFERRRHLALRLPVAHEAAVSARPERQRQRIEKNRFPRASLAGEDRQPG